jgi:flagellar motility protein MotE (MotC chaperone)
MKKLLTPTLLTLPVSLLLYLGATVAFWKTPVLSVRAGTAARVAPHGASWEFQNPEMDQLITELTEEKKGLAKRTGQLDELSARLDTERKEINAARLAVQQLQTNFDRSVLRVQEEETANLKKLAKVYADMTPEGAAGIFAGLDDTTVAKIMVYMKEADTAAIFEALSKKGDEAAKRAAALSERLRLASFRSNPAK